MEYTIRPVSRRDAEGIAALRRMPGVFENTLGLPSARLEQTETFLSELGPNIHEFVAAATDGEGRELVVGLAGLTVQSNPRTRHAGTVGIFVHADWQGRGVGTALLSKLLDLADNWLMLVRVELGVFSDNQRAIHLYEKLGFQREGLCRMSVVRNGQYVDEVIMARLRVEG